MGMYFYFCISSSDDVEGPEYEENLAGSSRYSSMILKCFTLMWSTVLQDALNSCEFLLIELMLDSFSFLRQ